MINYHNVIPFLVYTKQFPTVEDANSTIHIEPTYM